MTDHLIIRTAVMSEHQVLEALQRRAALNNPGDREALLANPDAIQLPREQIASGHVFVADTGGVVVGTAAVISAATFETRISTRCLSTQSAGGFLPRRRRHPAA